MSASSSIMLAEAKGTFYKKLNLSAPFYSCSVFFQI